VIFSVYSVALVEAKPHDRPFVAGISGDSKKGAYSVALSGGYDDDVDLGYAL
jgi:hypothetical protein